MSTQVLVLPAEAKSAATARRAVESALVEAGLEALLDEALLLVTELVTNAVVHAGTEVELHIEVGPGRACVEVGDAGSGSLPMLRAEPDGERESGRGVFLLSALAQAWGTRHQAGGKSVWFELSTEEPTRTGPAVSPTTAVVPELRRVAPALSWLLGPSSELEDQLGAERLLGELLARSCVGLGLEHAWVLTDDAGTGPSVAAAHTRVDPDPDAARRALRARAAGVEDGKLVVPLRWSGHIVGALLAEPAAQLDQTDLALARLVGERLAGTLSGERQRSQVLRDRGALALLAEASELFAGTLNVTLAVSLMTQLVVPRFSSWAGVFLVNDHGVDLVASSHEHEAERTGLQGRLGAEAVQQLAAALSDLPDDRPRPLTNDELPEELRSLGHVLAVPLVARGRQLGLLLAGRARRHGPVHDDAHLLLDLARRAAVAVDNARLYEERSAIAQALQSSLLPPELPVAELVQFGARYAAAGRGNDVGGDFYDVFAGPGGTWTVALGDVCGKGAEAATITGLARNVIRLFGREAAAPAEVLRRLNTAIIDLERGSRFCTALMATLTPVAGGLEVRLTLAGHPPPVRVSADGHCALIGTPGSLLGVIEEVDLHEDLVLLGPGDSLVFYTDGVTERRDGSRMFGNESLLATCSASTGLSATEQAGRLELAVRSFSQQPSRDDLAVLVVKVATAD